MPHPVSGEPIPATNRIGSGLEGFPRITPNSAFGASWWLTQKSSGSLSAGTFSPPTTGGEFLNHQPLPFQDSLVSALENLNDSGCPRVSPLGRDLND